jgi:hypothetical protein
MLSVFCFQHSNISRRASIRPYARCCLFYLSSTLRPASGYERQRLVVTVWVLMIHVAMGSISNARWISHMVVEVGNICVMQGTKSIIDGQTRNLH